jgi:hypothetical protein
LEPWLWEPLGHRAAGPAGLCLSLLAQTRLCWQNVAREGEQAPAPRPAALAQLPAAATEVLLPVLCAPWLDQGQEAVLEQLERHLEFRADYPGIDCASCAEQQEAGEGPPDCRACPLPPLPAAGLEALRLAGLLRGLPPGAGALLPALLAGRGPGHLRLLLSALGIIQRRLAPRPGAASGRHAGVMLK